MIELEFLRSRADVLPAVESQIAAVDDEAGWISDFWLGQSLAYNEEAAVQEAWRTWSAQRATGKLLVVLLAGSAQRIEHWRRIVRQYRDGPRLFLDANDEETCRAELMAAWLAVQP